ncbi:alpha/beta hydrolase [Ancylobacter sp. IITR112]|uniref:alpha/beta hydrolase n=1 Tax=Ancylobacter sp. IITR112 TaxID=3138073 RepID=UPI00352A0AC1
MSQPEPARHVLVETANVRVVRTAGTRTDVVFVTFEPHVLDKNPERQAFAEKFLRDNGFPAYHFFAADNFWFQYPEMEEVLARVRADIAPGTEVVAYAVSMGAYAAIRFAGRLGVTRILAFSPQYSIDPKKVPWDRRWDRLFDRPRQVLWEHLMAPRGVPVYLCYDPHNRDRRHMRLYAREADVVPVRVPYAGHGSITVMMQTGLLGKLVLDVGENRFDPAAFQRELAGRLDRSPLHREKRALKRRRLLRRLIAEAIDRFGL